jgi:hypothetical protein
MKNNTKAQQYIDKAIEIAPENSFHHQFNGILNFGLGNYKAGLESFNLYVFVPAMSLPLLFHLLTPLFFVVSRTP